MQALIISTKTTLDTHEIDVIKRSEEIQSRIDRIADKSLDVANEYETADEEISEMEKLRDMLKAWSVYTDQAGQSLSRSVADQSFSRIHMKDSGKIRAGYFNVGDMQSRPTQRFEDISASDTAHGLFGVANNVSFDDF